MYLEDYVSTENDNEKLDILEKNVNELEDLLVQLTTHQNRLINTMKNIESTLDALVSKSIPSGEYNVVNVNIDDLSKVTEAWFEGLDAVGVCYEDVKKFMSIQKIIVAYILTKAVIKKTKENK